MTREEFIKKYKNDCRYYFDGYYSDCIDDFLTNIYNDHEAQLKAKDEEIIALKAECEYDQRNAARSQRESVSLLDKIKFKDNEIDRLNSQLEIMSKVKLLDTYEVEL